jgi:biotin carboxylase
MLCLASYEKGQEFLREAKRLGCRVLLVTLESLREADWPREAVDDIFYMPTLTNREDTIKGISYLARSVKIDRIVPLDDYDVETAALLREHLRIPGMGETTARYFRDKLAMRVKARSSGLRVPEFIHVLNYDALREWMARVAPPWLVKPRSEASAIGIRKIHRTEELWPLLEELGDRQSFFLMEQFIAGEVFHVDSIVSERKVVFAVPHMYGATPMSVAHEGGVFTTRRLSKSSSEAKALLALNRKLIAALGLVRGVTHTEFIKARDSGEFYFLETAARVGGANIAEVVEAATGVNLWREWARIEVTGEEGKYTLPRRRNHYSGIVISLARQEWPDTSAYNDKEIVWRLKKRYHAGLIVASSSAARVEALLEDYTQRFRTDFMATAPLPDKPTA